MADPIRIDPREASDPLRRVEGAPSTRRGGEVEGSGAAFQALLEKLQAQATELSTESRMVERPAELSEAARRARDTFEGALAIHERLLEAFRQANQQGEPAGEPEP